MATLADEIPAKTAATTSVVGEPSGTDDDVLLVGETELSLTADSLVVTGEFAPAPCAAPQPAF